MIKMKNNRDELNEKRPITIQKCSFTVERRQVPEVDLIRVVIVINESSGFVEAKMCVLCDTG